VTRDIYEEKASKGTTERKPDDVWIVSHQAAESPNSSTAWTPRTSVHCSTFIFFLHSIDRSKAGQPISIRSRTIIINIFLHRHHHRRKRRRTKMTLTVCVGASGSGKSMHAKLANKGISFGLFRQKQLALSALRLTPSLTHTIVKQRYLLFCYTSLTFFLTPSISYNNYRQNYLPQRCAQIS